MVSIQQLVYFCKVVEAHSMNKAAEQSFVTISALSRNIKCLEKELKVVLFERNNRGVKVTDAGERLYRYATRLLHQMELITELGEKIPNQSLLISSFPFLFLPVMIEKFLLIQDADVHLEMEECRVGQVISNVGNGISEIGLVQYNTFQNQEFRALLKKHNLNFTPVFEGDWLACVGPISAFYNRNTLTIEELASVQQLRPRSDSLSSITDKIRDQGIELGEMMYSYVSSSFAALHLLRKTDCWMVANTIDSNAANEYGLHIIPIAGLNFKIRTGWVKRENHILTNTARNFVESVTNEFNKFRIEK